MKDIHEYIREHGEEFMKTHCRSCQGKADKKLIHKETMKEYPFCQKCIDKGFYNKQIFDIK